MSQQSQNIDDENMEQLYELDTKRVLILYSTAPNNDDTKNRADNLKKSWEKLYGENTCEVVILSVTNSEKVETLV